MIANRASRPAKALGIENLRELRSDRLGVEGKGSVYLNTRACQTRMRGMRVGVWI